MLTCNARNERIKRDYFNWSAKAKGRSPTTINHAGRAIRSYERFTGYKDFKTFSSKQAEGYRAHLANDPSETTGKLLSISTQNGTLVLVRQFFRWLGSQPGYRQAINRTDTDFLSVSNHDHAIVAYRKEPKPFPTCDQVVHVLRNHPTATDLENRDRALIAFLLLTCARVASIRSVKLKHVDLEGGFAFLDAQEVSTKKSKTFSIYFFPVDPIARTIVTDWINYLRDHLGFTDDDPLFPATAQVVGPKLQFTNDGVSRNHWKTSDPIRELVRKRMTAAGQPYFNPHLFRKTIAQLGETLCTTAEEFKAWSQNMGHDSPITTFTSYGEVPAVRQGALIRSMADTRGPKDADVLREMRLLMDKLERDRS